MGNHTIDCEYCGRDQRMFGGYCCETKATAERAKEALRERERDELREYLAQFGLVPRPTVLPSMGDEVLYARDVVALLKRLKVTPPLSLPCPSRMDRPWARGTTPSTPTFGSSHATCPT